MKKIGSLLKSFGMFWYEFIIGDDWTAAAAMAAGIACTWGLSQAGIAAWWLLPLTVVASVALSIWRLERRMPKNRS